MNGPERYRKAKELLGFADNCKRGGAQELSILLEAQANATLALAAAVGGLDAIMGPGGGSATGRTTQDRNAWNEVTGGSDAG